ncbi:E3 ubiquitin-protein ligase TRIM71-like [Bolinopsis microptera]|uniref:E3 ubiquitin-protein ligase TRIM71-like n=1 Tax=Bolinopsis microptera TaxID=2820187 RepID=UPI00307B062A
MVQMSSTSSLPDLKTRNEVSNSRNDVPKSRDLELEDVDDSRLYNNSSEDQRSSLYLQNHAVTNSDKACEVLRNSVEDAVRDLRQRATLLEAGIAQRKEKVLKSLVQGKNVNISSSSSSSSSASSTLSDLFKLLDRRNYIKISNGGASIVDYKEFMFFDRGSARHLNHSIKTLGDPSFNVSYSRDYDAIALNPEIFGSPGNKLDEFRGPTAITTDARHTYVCDSMNCRIVVYSDDNQPLYSIGQKGQANGELDRPSSVAVDETGQLYVADSFNDRICIYSTEGDWKFNVGGRGKLNKPRGVACAKNGEIFVVSDTGNQRILVYSGSGTCKGNFGKLGMKEGQFVRPQGIEIHDNKVYVSDSFNYRIHIFDIEGRLLDSIGKQGSEAGEFEEPRDIAIDTNGNVLVTDTKKNSLQIFDKNGSFIREYGSTGNGVHQFDGPEGVHSDEINRVFIADRKNDRIQIL